MSKDNVKQMFGKMEKDAELQKKYASLMRAHQIETEKNLVDKLVELGKASGFAFSKDDLLAARAELADKVNDGGELSEKDLVAVAGGASIGEIKGLVIANSILSLGIICAGVSIAAEANEGKGACGTYLTTANC